MVVPTTFAEPVVPTNVVGTTIHINSLEIGQFNFFWEEMNKKIISGEIWPPSQNDSTRMNLLWQKGSI